MATAQGSTAQTNLTPPVAPSKEGLNPQFIRRVWRAFWVALATIISTLEYAIMRDGSSPLTGHVENVAQPPLESLWQAACVMVLSYLAFEVHNLPARAHDFTWNSRSGLGAAVERGLLLTKHAALIAMFLLPTTLFFVAMMNKYQAAVFTMALIAIFVAAEHFSGLSQQEVLLSGQRAIIATLGVHVDSLSNVFGLEHGKQRLYAAYRESTVPIRAIVEYFDIDAEWWKLVDEQNWQPYIDGASDRTLFDCLVKSPCKDVLFVCDIKLPCEDGDDETRAIQFNNFIGMTWQWLLFAEVAKKRTPSLPCCFDIRVASASAWMHVAKGNVYQVLKGKTPVRSVIRDLSAASATGSGGKVLDWAQEEILRAEAGSCSAAEYLCTTFCWAAHKKFASEHELTSADIGEILKKLGMGKWIDRKYDFLEEPPDNVVLEKNCCAIASKFFEAIRSNPVPAVSPSVSEIEQAQVAQREGLARKGFSLSDLTREVV